MNPDYTGRIWSITLEANVPLLTANDRLHRYAQASRISDLRTVAAWMAVKQRIPKITYAHVLGYLLVTDERRRDPANWQPTAKALLDGLAGDPRQGPSAQILPDDSSRYVLGPHLAIAPGQRTRGFVLRIREMTGMPEPDL